MTYKIKPIHSEADYDATLTAVSPLFDNAQEPGSEASDFLEV